MDIFKKTLIKWKILKKEILYTTLSKYNARSTRERESDRYGINADDGAVMVSGLPMGGQVPGMNR